MRFSTGVPTISGTAEVGHFLTTDASGINDEKGLANAEFAYQWLRADANIFGATDSTYTLTADDEGSAMKVQVSLTDDGYTETLTSAAYLVTTDDLNYTIKVQAGFTDDNGYAETATSASTTIVN